MPDVASVSYPRAFWKSHKNAFANQRALNRENFEKWAT